MKFDLTLRSSRSALRENQVHVWCFSQAQQAEQIEQYERLLAPDERARARRYRFDRDRICSVLARGILRTILSSYLGIKPHQVVVQTGARGKPRVVDEAADRERIFFNLSHSGDVLLYAFSYSHRIGIDVETIAPERVTDMLVSSSFSAEERRVWEQIPRNERERHFYRIWTRKEAYMKGLGVGLGLEPTEFTVPLHPDKHLAGHRDENDRLSGPWQILDIELDAGSAAALAYEGRRAEVSLFRLNRIIEEVSEHRIHH